MNKYTFAVLSYIEQRPNCQTIDVLNNCAPTPGKDDQKVMLQEAVNKLCGEHMIDGEYSGYDVSLKSSLCMTMSGYTALEQYRSAERIKKLNTSANIAAIMSAIAAIVSAVAGIINLLYRG